MRISSLLYKAANLAKCFGSALAMASATVLGSDKGCLSFTVDQLDVLGPDDLNNVCIPLFLLDRAATFLWLESESDLLVEGS